MSQLPNIGLTIGDFNGVGPELILNTFSNDLVFKYCTPVVYTNKYILTYYSELLGISLPEFNTVRKKEEVKEGKLNIRICNTDRLDITPGKPSEQAGKVALEALQLAVSDIKSGIIENVVTAPIDKATIVSAGLKHNGHTGFFAEEFESNVQMILLNDNLRVAMVTGHTALKDVSEQLTKEAIVESIISLNKHLQADFGIKKPKIAVLGINPHAGDGGLMGTEEQGLISPAIQEVKEQGVIAVGPYPPDGFFGSKSSSQFDGVVGMYHDQVLIPFKQVAFSDGVNYTAGLPIIRTSPDHGTAYDIAGKGIVDNASFVNALYLINKIYRNRMEYYDNTVEHLDFREHRREKFSIGVPNLR